MVYHGIETKTAFAFHTLPTDPRARRIARRIAKERAKAMNTNGWVKQTLGVVFAVAALVAVILISALTGSTPTPQEACRGHEGTTITVPARVVTDNPAVDPNTNVELGC